MVNISKLELTKLQQRIARLFFIKAGATLNVQSIARNLKVSPPAILKAIPLLEKKEIILIRQDKESKRWEIKLNKENHRIIWMKKIDNLSQIYESGLIQQFYNEIPEATIILFGSYTFGEDTKDSDIDIAVIGSKKEIKLEEFEKKLERKIIINHYKSFKEINKHLLNNILNGITLKGNVEL
jgi:predicted nucleotidyltransferase